jgi:hypothetical protein
MDSQDSDPGLSNLDLFDVMSDTNLKLQCLAHEGSGEI